MRTLVDSLSATGACEAAQRQSHPLRRRLKQEKRFWRKKAEFWFGGVNANHFSLERRLERILRQEIL
jgi:hypothetical protein